MSDILESEIVDLVSSDDEEAESSQNVSEPNVRTHDYACIPCINKVLYCSYSDIIYNFHSFLIFLIYRSLLSILVKPWI
jgi:hypothetical protein